MSLVTIRRFCMVGLPLLLVIAALLHFLGDRNQSSVFFSIVSFYTIVLTANIGYFTNYVAIKMLFKPHFKTAFGRQGLIPKNQQKLADSLSSTLINNFLSKEQWREYLAHSDLVNKVIVEAKLGSKNWLKQTENIEMLHRLITDYLREHRDPINQYLGEIQQQFTHKLTDQIDPQTLLAQGFEWLEKQFDENPQQMQNMIEPIIKTVAENIPEIAESLVKALDNHIEEQDTIKRGIAKVARWSTDFSSEDIRHYLFAMVASFEFRETLFVGLKKLVIQYKEKPILVQKNSSQIDDNIEQELSMSSVISKLINSIFTSTDWVEIIAQKLSSTNLNETILLFHDQLFLKIESELTDGSLHTWIIDELVSMIEKLDLRQMVKNKAVEFSPKKMESIFQNMISEQLVFIELLGAVLGGLSGLALIDIRVFAILTSLFASYFIVDNIFTNRKKNLSNQQVSTNTN